MTLSPTSRLILACLAHRPNQSQAELLSSTGIPRPATLRELITLLIALKLVKASDTTPATYSATEAL